MPFTDFFLGLFRKADPEPTGDAQTAGKWITKVDQLATKKALQKQ
ncbi:hypothetical protein [Devosia yakushimensis]|nr:hypothetical protein [Devosia yakushimensis]